MMNNTEDEFIWCDFLLSSSIYCTPHFVSLAVFSLIQRKAGFVVFLPLLPFSKYPWTWSSIPLKSIPLTSKDTGTGPCGGWMLLAYVLLHNTPPTYPLCTSYFVSFGSSQFFTSAHKVLPSCLHFRNATTSAHADSMWKSCLRLSLHSNLNKKQYLWFSKVIKNHLILSIPELAGRCHHFVHMQLNPWLIFAFFKQSNILYSIFSVSVEHKQFFPLQDATIFTLQILFSNSFETLQNVPLRR